MCLCARNRDSSYEEYMIQVMIWSLYPCGLVVRITV